MHGGPFANIAHGCNSVRATKLALKLADYCITEAGFGSDLGAEKFLDIKCRYAGLKPSAIVVVATCRALKYNGGVPKAEVANENLEALKKGIVNLGVHIENMRKYNVPVIVAINQFGTDTKEELEYIENYCRENGADFALSNVFGKGGDGGVELAQKVVEACEKPSDFAPIYPLDLSIEEKVEKIATEIYGASKVNFTPAAKKAIAEITSLGGDKLPVCVAKTQYSLSDNPALLGAPKGFEITVRNATLSNGAGFVVVYTGDIMTMPGLPKAPAAHSIDIDEDGKIVGLF
jgi:formate--tetrahydrofolate ligase